MGIELGDLHLTKIHDIRTVERSQFVYHRVPGLDGAASQDLGRDSTHLVIEGIFYGPEAKDGLEKLRDIHTAHEPVDFIADITGNSYVGKVILDTFEARESAREPDQLSYVLRVSEYVKPPQASAAGGFGGMDLDALAAVDAAIGLEVDALLDIAALPDLLTLGTIPELSNPLEPLQGAMNPVHEAVTGLTDTLSGLTKLFGD